MPAGTTTTNDMHRFPQHNRQLFAGLRTKALEVKDHIDALSPLLEAFTASVCPSCKSVCCIHRHSRYDRSDMIYMTSLGRDVLDYRSDVEETAPCRFLSGSGCILERSLRPYRCTWYFCTPLLEHIMTVTGSAEYRNFVKQLQQITEKRMEMINHFEEAFHFLHPSVKALNQGK